MFEALRKGYRVAAGKELGIDTNLLLQPVGFHGLDVAPQDRPPIVSFYDALVSDLPAGLESAVDALRGAERAYVDLEHYSDQGCYEVARALAQTITRRRGSLPR